MKASPSEPPETTRGETADLPFPLRVARVRHDLNNSITHIVGFGEILLEEVQEQGREPLRADLELINRTAGEMMKHINESLNSQRIEAGLAALAQLQERLCDAASQIGAAVERLTRNSHGQEQVFQSDLSRMAGAARRVSELACTTLAPLSPPAAAPGFQTGTTVNPLAALLRPALEMTRALPAQKQGDILVVDDLEENRELLSRRLSRLGYSVKLADNGARALEFVTANPVDVILLDIMMPGMDGFEVLQRLKNNPASYHIPVLMLSSADDIDTVVRCIQLGADDFLPKPFNTTLLMARLESSLSRKRLRDQETAFLKRLQAEQDTSERLLLNILPKPIAERLKQGEKIIADSFSEVTVLFSDFVDFTKLSAKLTPRDLVRRLNDVFSAFDELCERHGLEKIKMIGDAYMVVGGAPTPRADHAEAVADLALDMQRETARFTAGAGRALRMRIGINTGPVVAGVIGTKKFAYDLWGDTVNLASRMENHAPTDGILVAALTYQRLRDRYTFEPERLIRVKGKGAVPSYRLLGKSG
jgi:adenylate cyclase